MYLPGSFVVAVIMTVLSAVFWGSWANTYKGTKAFPFALFYWDYIIGVVLCALIFAVTLGSHGSAGEAFVPNLLSADRANWGHALLAGAIFNVANLLLVAAIEIAGLSIAFPIAIGIAVVEGVVLSYALQPKGSPAYLLGGIALAICAVLFDARAYRSLAGNAHRTSTTRGIVVSVISGVLMGGFAPFVARAMTHGQVLTPYSVSVLFAVGALLCCCVVNVYFMRYPLIGLPVSFGEYRAAGLRNHALGVAGGVAWGIGGCFNFIAAGFLGVPISYAIGQSAPLIAASWGIWVWHEFRGAGGKAHVSLAGMFVCYIMAVAFIAMAYDGT